MLWDDFIEHFLGRRFVFHHSNILATRYAVTPPSLISPILCPVCLSFNFLLSPFLSRFFPPFSSLPLSLLPFPPPSFPRLPFPSPFLSPPLRLSPPLPLPTYLPPLSSSTLSQPSSLSSPSLPPPPTCVRSLFAQTVVAMTLTCIVECVVPCTGRSLPPT